MFLACGAARSLAALPENTGERECACKIRVLTCPCALAPAHVPLCVHVQAQGEPGERGARVNRGVYSCTRHPRRGRGPGSSVRCLWGRRAACRGCCSVPARQVWLWVGARRQGSQC